MMACTTNWHTFIIIEGFTTAKFDKIIKLFVMVTKIKYLSWN